MQQPMLNLEDSSDVFDNCNDICALYRDCLNWVYENTKAQYVPDQEENGFDLMTKCGNQFEGEGSHVLPATALVKPRDGDASLYLKQQLLDCSRWRSMVPYKHLRGQFEFMAVTAAL
ncbi:hypothetical protein Tco_1546696 [Tanacetum coccineum]